MVFYPFDVTVKFRLIPAQDPTGPQSVGGLSERVSERSSLKVVRDGTYVYWTTSGLWAFQRRHVRTKKRRLIPSE